MLKAFLLIVLTAFYLFLPFSQVSADTVQSRRVLNPVLVQENNGTMYLSTQAENDTLNTLNSSTSGTSTYSAQQQLQNVEILIPRGFAASFSGLINGVLSFVLIISALLVLFYLLWGGFDWITSGGDKGKTEKARNKIVAAVIGLIIVAASFAILNLVIRFLGFTNLNDVFDSAGTIQGGAGLAPRTASDSATATQSATRSGFFRVSE